MNINNLDLHRFVSELEERTINNQLDWSIEKYSRHKYLERSVNYDKINSVYINKKDNGDILAIGNFDRRVYRDTDEYYFEDVYFISFDDNKTSSVVTFVDSDELGMSFQVKLGKLYRIIQIKTTNIEEKIDNWFD